MEKQANNIVVSVFAHDGENAEEIEKALLALFPFNLAEEKIPVKKTTATGFNEKNIIIIEVVVDKQRHIRRFIEKLREKLNDEQKIMILRQAESRLDEEFNFFIRLDKEKMLGGEYCITDSGNCYHTKINIACFPKKRENGLAVIREMFK